MLTDYLLQINFIPVIRFFFFFLQNLNSLVSIYYFVLVWVLWLFFLEEQYSDVSEKKKNTEKAVITLPYI